MKKITINMQSEQKYCIIELKGNLKENNTYWIEIDLLFPKSALWFSEESVRIRQCYAKKENDIFSQINPIQYFTEYTALILTWTCNFQVFLSTSLKTMSANE